MVDTPYVPARGDLVWIDLDPVAGHEQAGRRPAIVVSSTAYNTVTRLCICCPVTRRAKGYPFEVAVAGDREGDLEGVILSDQVRCQDWSARHAQRAGHVSDDTLSQVLSRLRSVLLEA